MVPEPASATPQPAGSGQEPWLSSCSSSQVGSLPQLCNLREREEKNRKASVELWCTSPSLRTGWACIYQAKSRAVPLTSLYNFSVSFAF